jgi:hypothetical protein
MVHTCNPSTQEMKAGGSQVQGQQSYTLSPCLKKTKAKQNKQTKKKKYF